MIKSRRWLRKIKIEIVERVTIVQIKEQQNQEHIFTLNEGGEEGGNSLGWITCCTTI